MGLVRGSQIRVCREGVTLQGIHLVGSALLDQGSLITVVGHVQPDEI